MPQEQRRELVRQQSGYIWKVGRSWYGRWREDGLENAQVVRKQVSGKLAEVCDRFRSNADVGPYWQRISSRLPLGGYKSLWKTYLSARLDRIIVRDFRTVDAGGLLADIHREHKLGTTTLKHIKSFLSGVFTYAKNQGAFDGVNPIRDAMIPKKAEKPSETYAVSPDAVLAMMEALGKAGQQSNVLSTRSETPRQESRMPR